MQQMNVKLESIFFFVFSRLYGYMQQKWVELGMQLNVHVKRAGRVTY